jgi:ABC-type bacteriocin/lantibiotic exporter with double-glycine peptidase domain
MAANALGKRISYKDISQVTDYKRKEGLSNTDLTVALKELGFKVSESANTSWDDLKKEVNKKDNVVIVSWMLDGVMGHFSVVKSVNDTHIVILDPNAGKAVKIPRVKFMRLWIDYDEMWYPEKNTDIQLRWCAVVSLH